VLVDANDPNRFFLYEVYRDAAAIEAHEAAPHFQRIGAALDGWLASPATAPLAHYVDPPGG
jgi:autoinducer 2-degrading protein